MINWDQGVQNPKSETQNPKPKIQAKILIGFGWAIFSARDWKLVGARLPHAWRFFNAPFGPSVLTTASRLIAPGRRPGMSATCYSYAFWQVLQAQLFFLSPQCIFGKVTQLLPEVGISINMVSPHIIAPNIFQQAFIQHSFRSVCQNNIHMYRERVQSRSHPYSAPSVA